MYHQLKNKYLHINNPSLFNLRHTSVDIAWILVNTSISTSKRKFRMFLTLPSPRGCNFLNIHPRKKRFNIKDVEYDFRMGCILVFFSY